MFHLRKFETNEHSPCNKLNSIQKIITLSKFLLNYGKWNSTKRTQNKIKYIYISHNFLIKYRKNENGRNEEKGSYLFSSKLEGIDLCILRCIYIHSKLTILYSHLVETMRFFSFQHINPLNSHFARLTIL